MPEITEFPTFGPFEGVERARETADLLVDPPLTHWVVIELFGPDYDMLAKDGSGETWGTLYVIPADREVEFEQLMDAEGYTIVDDAGYDPENADPEDSDV